jgi:hypothetical protein
LIYAQSFFVISVRGMGLLPTTSDSTPSGVTGFMNAAFGFRADFFFLATAVSFVEGRPIGVGGAYHIREPVGLRFQRGDANPVVTRIGAAGYSKGSGD